MTMYEKADSAPTCLKRYPTNLDPKVPPIAEKIIIRPDIGLCKRFGKALRTTEFIKG